MFLNLKRKEANNVLKAYVSGKIIPITEVEDKVFSEKMMGDGIAIYPKENFLTAPANGTVEIVMPDSKHACSMKLSNGIEILLHIGLGTVKMKGEGFILHVNPGDKVKTGDKLISFDLDLIKKKGHPGLIMMVIIDNGSAYDFRFKHSGEVTSRKTDIAAYAV